MDKSIQSLACVLGSMLVACFLGCRSGHPERVVTQIDKSGDLSFIFSDTRRPAIVQQLMLRRAADGELVCLVEGASGRGGKLTSWRYGGDPGSDYKIEGCEPLDPGVYRLELQVPKYGNAVAYGACDVCVEADGRMLFGKPNCNKGTCEMVK